MGNQNRKQKAKTPAKANRQPLILGIGLLAVIAVGVLLAVAFNGAGNGASQTASLPREVSVAEAYNLREEGAFMLDVRTVEEWVNDGRMDDATLIPLDVLASRVSELPTDQQIVVVCRSGNRSAEARDILLQAGFEQVTSMAGGMRQWQQAGYPAVFGP